MAKRIVKSNTKEKDLGFIQAFNELKKQVAEEKILDRSYPWYILHLSLNLVGMTVGAFLFYISNNILGILASCLVTAFFTVQWGGMMHDAGHLGITKSKRWNNFWGMVACGITGTSFSEWNAKHNNHHNHVNEEDEDGDLKVVVLSYTLERAKNRPLWQQKLIPFQHWLYLPIFSLATFSFRINHFMFLIKFLKNKKGWLELAIFMVSNFVWLVVPIMMKGWLGVAWVIIVNLTISQYIAHIFAPNHKGMPEIAPGVKLTFFEQQIITARNLIDTWLIDYVYLGLNYQIEHHLFPSCPRPNQPKLAKLVRAFCKKMSLPYEEVKPWEVDRILFTELRAVAKQFRIAN